MPTKVDAQPERQEQVRGDNEVIKRMHVIGCFAEEVVGGCTMVQREVASLKRTHPTRANGPVVCLAQPSGLG